ncbi:MAG: Calcium-binding EF-hand-containing protein [Phycisphaerales bacterium]|nr:Calcium-binding EF-hand-containing protein [Phycisphaerales bacterium]
MSNELTNSTQNNERSTRPRRIRTVSGLMSLVIAGGFTLLLSRTHSEALPPSATPAEVTFAHDIAPLLYANCVSCHHDGGGGPFPLMTYKDAAKHADLVAQVTASHQMPPWKAEANYGTFMNERHLSEEQIALFAKWNEAGKPAGDLAAAPAPPNFDHDAEWALGKPDLVVQLPETFTVPADGRDIYRCFVIPLNVTEDHFVSAVEYRPSNRSVVHHAILYLDQAGQARQLEKQFHTDHPEDKQAGYSRFGGPGFLPGGGLGGWAPGAMPALLPPDVARTLPKGSDLIIQTHFHPTGKPETERSTVGIYFAKQAPQHKLLPLILGNRSINIKPGDKNYVVTSDWTLPAPITLIGITPHAHLVCKSMDVWATLPSTADGEQKVPLIRIADWDFNWQGTYRYAAPMHLPAGATLHMQYIYDNSADNERNPNTPPKRVRMGEQTTDEMAYCFLEGFADRPLDTLSLKLSMMSRLRKNATPTPAPAAN